jgi:hypothetical protein
LQVGFVLGGECIARDEILKEQYKYGDLIFVEGDDFYQGGKTYRFFQYAARNFPSSTFVMKADDDSFLVLPLIEKQLRELPTRRVYWGEIVYMPMFFQANLTVLQFQEHRGWGYVLSMDLIQLISETQFPAEYFSREIFEDCLTGMMLRYLNLTFPDSHLVWSPERQRKTREKDYTHRETYPDEVRRIQ